MFGLCNKVGGDPASIATFCQNYGFGRTSGKVDGAISGNKLLAAVTYLLPGPNIFSTRGMLVVAVSHCRNSLRSADAGDFREA